VAARLEGRRVDVARAKRAVRTLASRHERLVVEGVGGLLVPLRDRWPVARFAADLRLPIIIVARASLGTINHSALTALAAKVHGLRVLGIVVTRTSPGRGGPAERTNPDEIRRATGLPVLAVLPHAARGPLSARVRRRFDRLARSLDARLGESAQ
jgi:dethiobiotin synthetase